MRGGTEPSPLAELAMAYGTLALVPVHCRGVLVRILVLWTYADFSVGIGFPEGVSPKGWGDDRHGPKPFVWGKEMYGESVSIVSCNTVDYVK